MTTKWERRESKEQSRKQFVSDNRSSVRLIETLSTNGQPKPLKYPKRKKLR